jgi:hypothetical protein
MVETINDIKGEQFMKVGKTCGTWCYDQWKETRQQYQTYRRRQVKEIVQVQLMECQNII